EMPLHWAVNNGYATSEVAGILVEHGADLEARNGDGETPLHRAVISCNTDITKALAQAGANFSAKDGK
ncbi:ankyrin repeat-containing domain protein, partial [Dendryphion nanum]